MSTVGLTPSSPARRREAGRQFDLADQAAFAAWSGDSNPIHLDPLLARRLGPGAPIVHGVHALLWALEAGLAPDLGPLALRELRVRFAQPIRVGQLVHCTASSDDGGHWTLRLVSEERECLSARCHLVPVPVGPRPEPLPPAVAGPCRERTFAELATASGSVPLSWPAEPGAFPSLSAALPAWQLAALLAASRVCGMECPGLHSLLAELRLRFAPRGGDGQALAYRVIETDERFAKLDLELATDGLEGTLTAFFRPAPVLQPSMPEVARLVQPGEFAAQRALVVGGSRGLGEATAKAVAAGGGSVWLTYHSGEADARRLVEEIRAHGADARCSRWDVTSGLIDFEPAWGATHLYYFPTPYISLNDTLAFSPDRLREYVTYYVEGFVRAVERVAAGGGPLRVFYPSSSALDEILPRAIEYAAAKAAGEMACRHLERRFPGSRFVWPRLPRTATDRTASVVSVATEPALELMLGHLRALDGGDP